MGLCFVIFKLYILKLLVPDEQSSYRNAASNGALRGAVFSFEGVVYVLRIRHTVI